MFARLTFGCISIHRKSRAKRERRPSGLPPGGLTRNVQVPGAESTGSVKQTVISVGGSGITWPSAGSDVSIRGWAKATEASEWRVKIANARRAAAAERRARGPRSVD
jgi:hypothetical protein